MVRDMPMPPAGSSPSIQADVAIQSAADPAGAVHPPAEAPPGVPAAKAPQPSPGSGKRRKLLYVALARITTSWRARVRYISVISAGTQRPRDGSRR